MSFLVVHDISDQAPYAILKVPESATTREVIRQAVAKAKGTNNVDDDVHEYVLLEEVVAPSSNGEDFLTAPPTQQRMVGMDECPLHIRSRWKTDSKFVLKKVGTDPSWRARLGNLMISGRGDRSRSASFREGSRKNSSSLDLPEEDEEDAAADDEVGEQAKKDVDNFLVCVFNVSTKVSYTILQVPKTSTSADVIGLALSKSRRGEEGGADGGDGGDGEDGKLRPERFVLVEETDAPPPGTAFGGPPQLSSSSGKGEKGQKGTKGQKRRRALDAGENVYLVQLAWKGAGRLVLEEREKLLREGQLHQLEVPQHLNICETHSDPMGAHGGGGGGSHFGLAGKMSPRIRRSSKIIASGVRRISRSFYGSDHHEQQQKQQFQQHQQHHGGSLGVPGAAAAGIPQPPLSPQPRRQKQRRVTTAAVALSSPTAPTALTAAGAAGAAGRVPPSSLRHPRPRSAPRHGRSRSARESSVEHHLSDQEEHERRRRSGSGELLASGHHPTGNGSAARLEASGSTDSSSSSSRAGRKLSKVNLRKLKIW